MSQWPAFYVLFHVSIFWLSESQNNDEEICSKSHTNYRLYFQLTLVIELKFQNIFDLFLLFSVYVFMHEWVHLAAEEKQKDKASLVSQYLNNINKEQNENFCNIIEQIFICWNC